MMPVAVSSSRSCDVSTAAIADSIAASVAARVEFAEPYRYFLLERLLPDPIVAALADLPLAVPMLDGVSGKREAHNNTRCYFDEATMRRHPVLARVAAALQSVELVRTFAAAFDAPLDRTFLRLEYAQDVDGFWLEPHTDLGVKKFTCLIYLSHGDGHETLGTDIYQGPDRHVGRSPFRTNAAMAFVPAQDTWHGFEKRSIEGVRRSVIVNYVSPEWRAREQLCFPEAIIRL